MHFKCSDLLLWCADDEAATENAEQTPTEDPDAVAAEPPAPEENVTEAPPPEDKVIEAPPPEDNAPPSPHPPPAEHVAPTEDVSAAVEDTVPPAEQGAPLPEPGAVSSQQIEPAEVTATAEDAEPPADSASAEHVTEQASGPVEAVAVETDTAAAAEDDETGLKPAPRIESGCRLDRDVLLASLQEVQNYLHQAGVQEQSDASYIERLSDMVRVLNVDMNNLRDYCERSQTQLESIRAPIKAITDKIFKTITVAEAEEEGGEQRKYKFVWLHLQVYAM